MDARHKRDSFVVRSACTIRDIRISGVIGIGANELYLQQTTGDSGSGARLGSFKEAQAGVGPVVSYAAQFNKIGVAASVKWLLQIGTDNALDGNYVWSKLGVTF